MTKLGVSITAAVTLAALILIGFFWVVSLGLGESICFDRHPWWGPPEDPNSTCSGTLVRGQTSRRVSLDDAEVARRKAAASGCRE